MNFGSNQAKPMLLWHEKPTHFLINVLKVDEIFWENAPSEFISTHCLVVALACFRGSSGNDYDFTGRFRPLKLAGCLIYCISICFWLKWFKQYWGRVKQKKITCVSENRRVIYCALFHQQKETYTSWQYGLWSFQAGVQN